MALEIALINGHPVVIDTPATGVPYYTNDNIMFANADKIARMNFAGSSKSTNPGASDSNYLPGAVWANTGTDQLYICVDNTSGAAQWKIFGSVGSVGSGLSGDGGATPLRVAVSPNANNAISLLANGLYASGSDALKVFFYPEDYGATPGFLTADSAGLTTGIANADAISNCIAAAWDYGNSYGNYGTTNSIGGASGTRSVSIAGSIGTRHMPVVVIDDHFQIAKPISIPQQGGYLLIDGYGGAISRWGYEDGIYSWDYQNPSGTFAIEVGMPYTDVSTTFHANIEGLRMYGFPRALRMGIAPNNVNLSRIYFRSCYFAGPKLSSTLPKTIGVRVFNRSSDMVFDSCTWDCYGTSLDIQSVDKVRLRDCRMQIGQNLFENTHLQRKQNQAQIVLQHGRLIIDGMIGNTPLSDASTQARYWAANSGIVQNQYIAFSGVSTLYGSGWSLTNPTRTIWRSRFALTTSGTLANETGNQAVFTSKWEPVRTEFAEMGNIDTQKYFWVWVKEFDSWQPNTEYLPGDCILQNYSGTADPVYWSRINYTTGSGPTWAADRSNWQVIDSMKYFTASESLVAGDIRLSNEVFYRVKSNASPSTAPTGNDVTWEIVTGVLITDATNYSWLLGTRAKGGLPISAWNDVTIQSNTLFGAENGGITSLFWSHPARMWAENSPIGLLSNGSNLKTYKWDITRKMPSNLTIRDSTLQTDRRIQDIKQTGIAEYTGSTQREWPAPIVLLSGMPSNINIINNYWNDSYCVPILYDPRAIVLPKVRTVSQGNYFGFTNVNVSQNYGGTAGRDLAVGGYPNDNIGRFVTANSVPDDLQMPLLTQVITGANPLSLLPRFSGAQEVTIGYLITGIDPVTSYQQLFRSKFHRRTSATFDVNESKYWDICETGTPDNSPDVVVDDQYTIMYLCPGKYEYRSNNPIAGVDYYNFSDLEPGKIYTIFHENNKTRYATYNVGGFLMATGASFVTAPSGGVVSFMPMNSRIIEINKNF